LHQEKSYASDDIIGFYEVSLTGVSPASRLFAHAQYKPTLFLGGCRRSIVARERAAEPYAANPERQISLPEETLGVALFLRVGRRLELTETGRPRFLRDEIFRSGITGSGFAKPPREPIHPVPCRVDDAVPKSVAYRLLTPAMNLAEPVRMVCREDKPYV
jgi:hypothetical protein